MRSSAAGTYIVVASTASSAAAVAVSGSGGGSLGVHVRAESAVLFGAVMRTNQTGCTGTGFVDTGEERGRGCSGLWRKP